MSLLQGFHILTFQVLEDRGLSGFSKTHILPWLRSIASRTLKPYSDLQIHGLEDLLKSAEGTAELSSYIWHLLRNNSSFLLNCGGIFLFPVEDSIEVWGQPVLKTGKGTAIELVPIFGSLRQIDVHWFHQQLNVQS